MSDDICNLLYCFPLVLSLPEHKKDTASLETLFESLPSVSKLTSIPCSYEMALSAYSLLAPYCCLALIKL